MYETKEQEEQSPKWAIGCLLMFVGYGATAIISGVLSQVICRKIWGVDHYEERKLDFFPFFHLCVWLLAVLVVHSFVSIVVSIASNREDEPQRRLVWSVVIASLIVTAIAIAHAAHYPWEPFFGD